MKRILLICLIFCLQSSFAQTSESDFNELLFEAKAQEMKKSLELNDKEFNAFKPLYKEYDSGLIETSATNKPIGYKKSIEKGVNSSQDAIKVIEDIYSSSEKMLNFRRSYIAKFAEILSPEQLIRFYQTESSIRVKIKNEFSKRK